MCGIKISLFNPFRHDGLGDLKRWDMGRHLLFTSWSSCSRSPPCPCPWWEGAWRGYKLKYYYMTIDNLITNSGSQLCRYLPNVVHHLVWYGDFSIWNAKQLVYRHNLTPAPASCMGYYLLFIFLGVARFYLTCKIVWTEMRCKFQWQLLVPCWKCTTEIVTHASSSHCDYLVSMYCSREIYVYYW